MKKAIFLFLALLAICSPSLYAYYYSDFQSGDLAFRFIEDKEDAVFVSGTSASYQGGDILVPSTVSYEGKDYRVEALGTYSFDYHKLSGLTLSQGLYTIEDNACFGCKQLERLFIAKDVNQIGSGNFSNCPALESIVVDEANPIYDSRQGCNAVIETTSGTLLHGCKNSQVPAGITRIGNNAFDVCSEMTSFQMGIDVKEVGESAFYGCSKLRDIDMSDQLEVIEDYAFFGCSALTSLVLPSTLKHIGYYAFSQCSALTDFVCLVTNPEEVEVSEDCMGYGCDEQLVLHVLPGLKQAFANSAFGHVFQQIEEDAQSFVKISVTEGDYIVLDHFRDVTVSFVGRNITDARINQARVVWSQEDDSAQPLLAMEQSAINGDRLTITFAPQTDLKTTGDVRLVLQGEVTANGEFQSFQFDILLHAFRIRLDEADRNTAFSSVPNSITYHLDNLNDGNNMSLYFPSFQMYQIVDGEKVMLYDDYLYFFSLDDPCVQHSSSNIYSIRPLQPGVIYLAGEALIYHNNSLLCQCRVGLDSLFYLPLTPEPFDPVSTASDLKHMTIELPEGFTYTNIDLSASTIGCYLPKGDQDDQYDYVTQLSQPTATIFGNLVTLDFKVDQEELQAYDLYLNVEGYLDVDGRKLHLDAPSLYHYRHPCFHDGDVKHTLASVQRFSDGYYYYFKWRDDIRMDDDREFITVLTMENAWDASLVEAEGRIFTLVDGQEVTLCTLKDTDTRGFDIPGLFPYMFLVWEKVDSVPSAELYCHLNVKLIVDGQEYVYSPDPTALLGYYYYKPVPSIPETKVIESADELKDLAVTLPDYASAQQIEDFSEVCIWASTAPEWYYGYYHNKPTCEGNLIYLHPKTDWVSKDDDFIEYVIRFSGYGGFNQDDIGFDTRFKFEYHYLTPKGAAAIQQVRTDVPASIAPCYNLQGKRIRSNTKGLIIKEGRKIFSY